MSLADNKFNCQKMTQRARTLAEKAVACSKAVMREELESIHFLVAMTEDDVSIPSLVLRTNGIERESLLGTINMIERENVANLREEIFEVAKRLGHSYPGPEHFLLAICRNTCWNGWAALRILGSDPEKIENDVYEILGNRI